MQVQHGLARVLAGIDYGAKTLLQISLPGQLRRHRLQVTQHCFIFVSHIFQRDDVFTWAYQQMCGRLRANIFKSENVRVFVYNFCGDLFRGDFAEKTVGAH
jgi:hypothetical protein